MKSKNNIVIPNSLMIKMVSDFNVYGLEHRLIKHIMKQTLGEQKQYTELDLAPISKSLRRNQPDIAFSIIQLVLRNYLVFFQADEKYYIGFTDSWFALFQIALISHQQEEEQ